MIAVGDFKLVQADTKHLPWLVRWKNSSHAYQWRPTTIGFEAAAVSSKQGQTFIGLKSGAPLGFVEVMLASPAARVKKITAYTELPQDLAPLVGMLADVEFKIMGTNKLIVDTPAQDPAVKVYESIGFKIEVRKRQHLWQAGKPVSVVQLGLLAKNYDRNQSTIASN